MRKNAPRLIDPKNALQVAKERSFGIPQIGDVLSQLDELDQLIGGQNRELNRLRSLAALGSIFSHATPDIQTTSNVKGSVTATNVTSTGGTTITNSNVTLAAGIRYLVIGVAGLTLNAPAGQTVISCVRIEATGPTVDGTRTTTTSGERWGMAIDFKILVGTGASVNIAGRARVTGGTATINDAISAGIAIPLGAAIPV